MSTFLTHVCDNPLCRTSVKVLKVEDLKGWVEVHTLPMWKDEGLTQIKTYCPECAGKFRS